MKLLNYFVLALSIFSLSNCEEEPDCSTSGDKTVQVSWDTPHAYQITNVTGGGHRIYYSSEAGVDTSSDVVDIPYASSPTSGTIPDLKSGCSYYFRVQAYSALNTTGGGLSSESSIDIP
jgi:hypothetical protein